MKQVESFPWPSPDWFDAAAFATQCEDVKSYATWGPGWNPIYCRICDLCTMETALTNMALHPGVVQAMVAKLEEFYLEVYRRTFEAAENKLDVFAIGDDFADDHGLMMGYSRWKKLFYPTIKKLFSLAKQYGYRIHFHCCGAMSEILPDLIDAGLDSIEPSQVHLPGMAPEKLKMNFGKHVTFLGAINTQHTLPYGTPEQVRAEVRERINVLAPDGAGYIVCSDHSVLNDVPVENVVAMYDEAERHHPWTQ